MTRVLAAFLWLRWRLFVNALRGGRRRDGIERASRVATLVAPLLMIVLVGGLATLLGVLAFLGGWMLGQGTLEPPGVLLAVRFVVLFVIAFLLVLSPGSSSGSGATRLMLLPIPRSMLHGIEVVAGLADPRIAALAPALVLFAIGLAFGGRLDGALVALAGAAGTVLLLLALGSLVTFLTSWLMRNRKRGELFALLSVLMISAVSVIPAFIGKRWEHTLGGVEDPLAELDLMLPLWTRVLPSELHGRGIGASLADDPGVAWASIALLFLEASVLYALSALVHARLLVSGGSARRARAKDAVRGFALFRVPGLSSAACAVALAQAKTTLRSVRGKLVVLMPGPLIAVIGLLSQRLPGEVPGGTLFGREGHVLFATGCVFCLYTLLAFSANSLAADRAGLTLQFLLPLRELDLVRGKTAGCAVLLACAVANCLVCSLLVAPRGSTPHEWIAVLLATAATYLWISPIAAAFSAVLPVASDLNKTGSGGNPHGLAFLLGTLLVLFLSAPPGMILYLGSERPTLALGLIALWTLLAAAISLPLLGLAARTVAARRENIALVAQGR